MPLAAGSRFGPYEIVAPLGSGGMGEVFLGHDPRLQRDVALKCLNAADSAGPDQHSRILREARAAARVNHPNIAGIYDVLEDGESAVIVMEYVDGESLRTRLGGAPIAADDIVEIGLQLAAALAAAHEHGVVHRDLTPANVQITATGIVKVLDFGVARLTPSAAALVETTAVQTRTGTGTIAGTPIYMAPEQLIRGDTDPRSDIYSLGAVLFEMATGRRPYVEADAVALAVAMSTMPAPRADSVNPRVPRRLSAVIAKALEREPQNRYQSAIDFAAALETARSEHANGSTDAGRVPASRPAPRWWLPAAVAVAVTLTVVSTPLVRRQSAGPDAARPAAVIELSASENRAGDTRGEYVGAALASLVATNFGSIAGVTVFPASSPAEQRDEPDPGRARRDRGITHVVSLIVRAVAPTTVVDARFTRASTGEDIWSGTISGDWLSAERALLDRFQVALQRERVLPRNLSASQYARLHTLPTTSASALDAFSEGRARLDHYDVPGNVDRAIQLFRLATDRDPRFAAAYAALGEALWNQYMNNKRPDVAAAATRAVERALSLDADQPPVHYALGMMQSQTGHYEEATASLRRALSLQPDNAETHRLLGRVLATLGDRDSAVSELRRAIALRPIWNNYYSLGAVLYAEGDYAGAIDALKKTTELRPTFADAYQMLGTTYHMVGNVPQAIGYYEHAVRLGGNAPAYANLGLAYYTARRFEDARQAYIEAIARSPRRASLYRSLGDVYVRLGRITEAHKLYAYAIVLARDDLRVNPRDALAVILIGNCEARLGRRAEAERHAAEATMLAPANRDVWIRTAKLYTALGERSSALRAVETAVSLGYEPNMIAGDDELQPLGPRLAQSLEAGLAARARKGVTK